MGAPLASGGLTVALSGCCTDPPYLLRGLADYYLIIIFCLGKVGLGTAGSPPLLRAKGLRLKVMVSLLATRDRFICFKKNAR
jgi:hypothetical protein